MSGESAAIAVPANSDAVLISSRTRPPREQALCVWTERGSSHLATVVPLQGWPAARAARAALPTRFKRPSAVMRSYDTAKPARLRANPKPAGRTSGVEGRAAHLLASYRAEPAKLTLFISSARGSRRPPRRARELHLPRTSISCSPTPQVDVCMLSPRAGSMGAKRTAATSTSTRPCHKKDLDSAKGTTRDARNLAGTRADWKCQAR